jgi:SecD/SecF fusion protein
MSKHAIWKWLFLIVLTACSLAIVTPLRDKVKLGLDLKGGISFVLEVDTTGLEPNALRDAQARAVEVIRNRVDAMGVSEPVIYSEPTKNRVVVQIPGLKPEDRERAIKNIESAAFLEFRMVHPKNDELTAALFEKGLAPDGYKVVSLDEEGMRGQWRTGNYYQRDKSKEPANETEEQKQAREQETRAKLKSFQAPPGYEFMLMKDVRGKREVLAPYFVSRRHELTGEALKNAGVDYQQFGQPYVTLRFDAAGSRRFGQLTSDYAPGGAKNPSPEGRRYLAIVLDGTLYSAPYIKQAIHGGQAIIEGSFSVKEAQDLSIVLRAGALPAPLKVVEERNVDPTLGRDSIDSGKRASFIGCGAVMVFMAGYYMLTGLVANIALLMNIILLPVSLIIVGGFFSIFNTGGPGGGVISLPTLTLPGIAGIALTIGMAVDANVLIYERIREEQAAGKSVKGSLEAGFHKAFSAIFDSNMTTILSAVILFWLGSGPVRGFAVTLTAGLIVSMYTAILVTRMILELVVQHTHITGFKMLHWIKSPAFDLVSKWKIFVAVSVIVIVASWVLMFKRGQDNLSVDFRGGASVTFQFQKKVPTEDVRAALDEAGIRSDIQYQKAAGAQGGQEYLEMKLGYGDGAKAGDLIQKKFAEQGYRVLKTDNVGPQIGKEFQKRAIWALSLSLLIMAIYVSFRFEFPYAIGAFFSLAHDALVSVGLYCALGHQLTMSSLAAVLTIIGYSVNDTIVIFDRIRENVKLVRNKPYREIANDSINQTLGRTVLTTGLTLLTVIALMIFGGGAIYDFVLLLFIGMISGVYSTIYIATPIVLLFHPEAKREQARR